VTEIEPGWRVTIMDRYNDNYQYPAILHNDHCIDLTRKGHWDNSGGAWWDVDGEPMYCKRCVVLIPKRVHTAYKGLIEMMKAGADADDPNGPLRHFFRCPTTKR